MTQDFSPVAGTLAAGDQIAGYQVGEQIGTGGMAVVYRARDLRLDRQVALKVLSPRLAEDDAFRQRFIRESRAAAGVDHPHIIPVFEAGEANGVLFIAMRYVSAGDVRTLIQNTGPLTPRRASTIASQAASALDAAHAHGLVHRDVKPGNILLDSVGGRDHVYLADFGLSKHSLATTTLTAAGQFMGTLGYVSPEQIQGHAADGRADQYALACTVVEMLAGTPPFKRDESMALLWAQLEAPPPVLTELRPDLPAGLNSVIGTALSKSPADRYPTCLAFTAALAAACEARPVVLREPTEQAAALPPPATTPSAGNPGGQGRTRPEPIPVMVPGTEDTAAAPPRQPVPSEAGRGGSPRVPAAGDRAGSPPGQDRGDRAGSPPGQDRGDRAGGPPGHADGDWAGHAHGDRAGDRPGQALGDGGGDRRVPPWQQPAAGKWTASQREPYLVPQRQQPPRRAARRTMAVIIGVAAVAGLGFAGYTVLNRPARHSSPPVFVTKTISPSAGPAALTPAGTVRAYFAAINAQDFRRAWQLIADHRSQTYQQFVNGFAGTRRDTVTIISTAGDVVTARLVAAQTNGTVKTFQGTYTVTNGVISSTAVHQQS